MSSCACPAQWNNHDVDAGQGTGWECHPQSTPPPGQPQQQQSRRSSTLTHESRPTVTRSVRRSHPWLMSFSVLVLLLAVVVPTAASLSPASSRPLAGAASRQGTGINHHYPHNVRSSSRPANLHLRHFGHNNKAVDDDASVDMLTTTTSSALTSEIRGGGVAVAATKTSLPPPQEKSGASVAAVTFSLVKACVGSGVLALPSGLAAISNYPAVVLPAVLFLTVLGLLSAYTFLLLGRLVDVTQASSLGGLWQNVFHNDSNLVSYANFANGVGCLLIYALIVGDALSSLVSMAVPVPARASSSLVTALLWAVTQRHTAILAVMTLVWSPLCRLSSLAALAPISIVGVLGSLVTLAFQAWRCPAVNGASPYTLPGGAWVSSAAGGSASSWFDTYQNFSPQKLSPAPLILVAMGAVSLMAHFGATDFYHALAGTTGSTTTTKATTTRHHKKDTRVNGAVSPHTTHSSALRKYTWLTLGGYGIVMAFNALHLTFGFLTFGGNAAGNILNSYAAHDPGAILARALVVVSLTGSFPILFGATRSAAVDLLQSRSHRLHPQAVVDTKQLNTQVTNALLLTVTAVSLLIKDAGFVVSFTGALLGTALIYTFPSLLFLRETRDRATSRLVPGRALALERLFCRFLVGFGTVSGIVGALTAVLVTFFPHVLQA